MEHGRLFLNLGLIAKFFHNLDIQHCKRERLFSGWIQEGRTKLKPGLGCPCTSMNKVVWTHYLSKQGDWMTGHQIEQKQGNSRFWWRVRGGTRNCHFNFEKLKGKNRLEWDFSPFKIIKNESVSSAENKAVSKSGIVTALCQCVRVVLWAEPKHTHNYVFNQPVGSDLDLTGRHKRVPVRVSNSPY